LNRQRILYLKTNKEKKITLKKILWKMLKRSKQSHKL